MTKKLILSSVVSSCLMICAAMPARAVDVSTHSFANCGFPDTGQKICYVTTGEVTSCAGAGQDGTYMPGAAQPGYTVYLVNSSSVTVDNRTGLMWITNPTDAGMGGTYTWEGALTGCESKDYATYSDWRLPNVRELESIVDYSKNPGPTINAAYFTGTQTEFYWTSTTYVPYTPYAWYVDFTNGNVYTNFKTNSYYVRCVRGGP